MDTNFWNKLILSIVLISFFIWFLSVLSDNIFVNDSLNQEGYPLPVFPNLHKKNDLKTLPLLNHSEKSIEEKKETIKKMMALFSKADSKRGSLQFQRCGVCHNATKERVSGIGPSLWGIVNRRVASVENYNYSKAIQLFSMKTLQWNDFLLFYFLKAPREYIPGTLMVFPGIPSAQDRADLIAYLHKLSSQPTPLLKQPDLMMEMIKRKLE